MPRVSTSVTVLIIDQFEELFSQSDGAERDALFAWLQALQPFERGRMHVIATIRSDYLNELYAVQPLWDAAMRHRAELRAMTVDELKAAIQRPLQARFPNGERRFEPALADALAKDAAENATFLPLLQVTLEEIWKKGRLDRASYGTLTDAIRQRADQVYEFEDYDNPHPSRPRSEADRAAVMGIFLDLVNVSLDDDDRRDVRISRAKDDLASGGRGKLINDLARARLLSVTQDGEAETVNIIHETLIGNWARLRDAVRERRQQLQARARFEQQVDEWLDHGKTDDYLLSGVRLAQARELERAGDIALQGGDAKALLRQSAERAEAEGRKRVRRLQAFVAGLVAVALVLFGVAGVAIQQRNEAIKQQLTSRSREIAAIASSQLVNRHDPQRVLLLALEAISTTHSTGLPTPFEVEDALRQAMFAPRLLAYLSGHKVGVNSATFSSDGKKVVTSSSDGSARIWDAVSAKEIIRLSGHESSVNSAAFSRDDTKIVTASNDKTVRIWDAFSGLELVRFSGHKDWVHSAAFSPDDKKIVSVEGNIVRIWEIVSKKEIARFPRYGAVGTSAIFSPDSKRIITSSDENIVDIWDINSGQEIMRLSGHEGYVNSAAFSSDGKKVVTASTDGSARIWNVESGQEIIRLSSNEDFNVKGAVFSTDGRRVATFSHDSALIWDASSGKEIIRLFGHGDSITSAAFSPDGTKLVTASSDSTAHIWATNPGMEVTRLTGHEDVVISAIFSTDSRRVVTASWDRTIRIWNTEFGTEEAQFFANDVGGTTSVALSNDGKTVAAVSSDNLHIWDAKSSQEITHLHAYFFASTSVSLDNKKIIFVGKDNVAQIQVIDSSKEGLRLSDIGDDITFAALAPNGKRAITISSNNPAQIWDANSGKVIAQLSSLESKLPYATFSPNSKRIITTGLGSAARIWDVESGKEIAKLTQLSDYEGTKNVIAFSSDSRRVTTIDTNNIGHIWDVESGKEVTRLVGHEGTVNSVSYSPDGRKIITASNDNTARIWNASSGMEIARLTGHKRSVDYIAGINSASFSPDGKKVVTTSNDGTALVYIVELDDLIKLAQSRLIRDLTCQERVQFLQEPLDCSQLTPTPTPQP